MESTAPDPYEVACVRARASRCVSPAARTRLLADLAYAERFRDPLAAIALADEAIVEADRSGEASARLNALRAATVTRTTVDHLDDLDRLTGLLAEEAIAAGSVEHHVHALLCAVFSATVQGHGCRRRSLVAQLHQVVDHRDDARATSFLLQVTSQTALSRGDLAAADAAASSAVDAALEAGCELATKGSLAAKLLVDWLVGRVTDCPADIADHAKRDPWISAWAGAQLVIAAESGTRPLSGESWRRDRVRPRS